MLGLPVFAYEGTRLMKVFCTVARKTLSSIRESVLTAINKQTEPVSRKLTQLLRLAVHQQLLRLLRSAAAAVCGSQM